MVKPLWKTAWSFQEIQDIEVSYDPAIPLMGLGPENVTLKSLSHVCNTMDYTVHGILQARTLEWVAFPFSRGSSQPRDQAQVSCIAGRFLTSWATKEAQEYWSG